MSIDFFSDEFRRRQKETLTRALTSGCTKKELAVVIFGTDKRTMLKWFHRHEPLKDLVTSDKHKTLTPAEVRLVVTVIGDPTKYSQPMKELQR